MNTNLFDPRTYSIDWEVLVVDRLNRCVDTGKLLGFAETLQKELDLPIQIDWNALEFAMGINSSLDQIWDRIQRSTDRAAQMIGEYDLDLMPVAGHPTEWMYNASHVHVGTLHDETLGMHLENQMMKYVPVFGALAANSPIAHGHRGGFKSYRIRDLAHRWTNPSEWHDPQMAQPSYMTDAAPKLSSAPTMEVRIIDSGSSRRFVAELATFVAAYCHYQGTRVQRDYKPTPEEYRECLTNRWAAARYGLQATFHWHGQPKPVVELIDEMLDECRDELEILGAKRSDLAVLGKMAEKRVCQADFAMSVAQRYSDPLMLASAYAKLVRHWDVFEEYLDKAQPLEPAPAIDEEAILAEHLECVGEGTYYFNLHEVMRYPAPAVNEILDKMLEKEMVRREVTRSCGVLLHRVE